MSGAGKFLRTARRTAVGRKQPRSSVPIGSQYEALRSALRGRSKHHPPKVQPEYLLQGKGYVVLEHRPRGAENQILLNPMNLTAALRTRLSARPDGEHEQAILRVVVLAVVVTYLAAIFFSGDGATGRGHGELLLLRGLAAALVLALVLLLAIFIWPAPNVTRRVVGMVADAGAATFVMFLAGEAGVAMVGVYLFITFGNGFRYGRAYLVACQALCLFGYSAVLLLAPYWQGHPATVWGLMFTLMLIPLYVSTLLKRIQQSRSRTEQALKECLSRERAGAG